MRRALWRDVDTEFGAHPPEGIPTSSHEWMRHAPARFLSIPDLTMTQAGVYFEGITHGRSESGDPVPHVVEQDGRLYVVDGHHRVMRTLLEGRRFIRCRVWRAP